MRIELNTGATIAIIAISVGIGAATLKQPDIKIEKQEKYIGEVQSVVCYDKDGTGPMETCPAKIECHNKPHTNSEDSLIPCPFF